MAEPRKVGYCNPPLETRIKKGERRNPNGRPRKKKPERTGNLGDDLEEALQQMVVVTMLGGKKRKVTARQAFALQTAARLLKGDKEAIKTVVAYERSQGAFERKQAKQLTGVVVVRAPCETIEEFQRRADAMPPLSLNPLEGLPGIDATLLLENKRRKTPDEE